MWPINNKSPRPPSGTWENPGVSCFCRSDSDFFSASRIIDIDSVPKGNAVFC